MQTTSLNSEFSNRNIILTGVPRSGTNLVCYLLNQLPNTIALSEPPIAEMKTCRGNEIEPIRQFFRSSRNLLLSQGKALSRQQQGEVTDNLASDRPSNGGWLDFCLAYITKNKNRVKPGLRYFKDQPGEIEFNKELSRNFLLCIKHNPIFTALLNPLAEHYRCFAIVRNPLAVLGSWNTFDFPGRDGHAPRAERVDLTLKQQLANAKDRFERQFILLTWCYHKYCSILPKENILRYEDIIETGGRSLAVITEKAKELTPTLTARNTNQLYDHSLMLKLGKRLLETDGAYWNFYSRIEIEALMSTLSVKLRQKSKNPHYFFMCLNRL